MMCGPDEKMRWTILVASKDELIHKLVAQAMNNNEHRIIAATSAKAFFEKLIEGKVDLIIYDPDLDPIDPMGAFSFDSQISNHIIQAISVEEFYLTLLARREDFLSKRSRDEGDDNCSVQEQFFWPHKLNNILLNGAPSEESAQA